ncbi:UDP-2,3-diacylglucosamine diphosphatase [Aphanothece stagnina]|uniref:UDP-2,3-diacylglucosamine diphosphatase n=1 Tax=Aphanothece stagnina TaxID=1004305 RepID=UPI00398F6187
MSTRRHYRSVFVSDIHLGAVGARTTEVRDFLSSVSCDRLYLVGDIIDGWVGRKDRKWTAPHTEVLRMILEFEQLGTQVFYCPGNHDAFLRRVLGVEVGNLLIEHSFTHTTVEGKELLVVHGDLFDKTVTEHRTWAVIGAWMHESISMATQRLSQKRQERGRRPIDLASMLKTTVKRYIGKKSQYEELICQYARDNGFDGVVCGHVHRPRIEQSPDGFMYVNTGDWVEHATAVVEHEDGTFELLSLWEPPASENPKIAEVLRGLVTPKSPE